MKKFLNALCVIIVIAIIIFEIWGFIVYKDKPVSEIPFWVLVFLK